MKTNVLAHSKTVLALLIAASLASVGLAWTTPTIAAESQSIPVAKSIFIVRHAEKLQDDGRDPELSVEGHARAAQLALVLADQDLDAIYVTQTRRSSQTAEVVAEEMGLKPTEYAPVDMTAFLGMIDTIPDGGSVLVVAHSNTVPMIVAALGGRAMDELPEDEYDRLITIVTEDGRHVRSIELRY